MGETDAQVAARFAAKDQRYAERKTTGKWPARICKVCQHKPGGCCQRNYHHVGDCCTHCGNDERRL